MASVAEKKRRKRAARKASDVEVKRVLARPLAEDPDEAREQILTKLRGAERSFRIAPSHTLLLKMRALREKLDDYEEWMLDSYTVLEAEREAEEREAREGEAKVAELMKSLEGTTLARYMK